jgi:hypothetical protein
MLRSFAFLAEPIFDTGNASRILRLLTCMSHTESFSEKVDGSEIGFRIRIRKCPRRFTRFLVFLFCLPHGGRDLVLQFRELRASPNT